MSSSRAMIPNWSEPSSQHQYQHYNTYQHQHQYQQSEGPSTASSTASYHAYPTSYDPYVLRHRVDDCHESQVAQNLTQTALLTSLFPNLSLDESSLATAPPPSYFAYCGGGSGSDGNQSVSGSVATTSSPSYARESRDCLKSPSETECLTEAEISRRTLAASGLNVAAPEFIPSFARNEQPVHDNPPMTPEPIPSCVLADEHSLSPPDTYTPLEPLPKPDVYSNVTDHLSNPGVLPPVLDMSLMPSSPSASAPALLEMPNNQSSPSTAEQVVNHFDEHFPALRSAPSPNEPPLPDPSLTPKALAWHRLEVEKAEKDRVAASRQRLDTLSQALISPPEHRIQRAWCNDLPAHDINNNSQTPPIHLQQHIFPASISNDVGSVWVTTGRSVGALYESLRAEAAQQASIRNKYFDRATGAFKRGDGATAKRFSAMGREANDRMKELHRKAADAIFEARNPPGVTDVIDLHGLHVAEALERLPLALEKMTAQKIRILTGTGHHTKGTGRARLRPMVEKWLQESGYFFEEVLDANEYVGSFIVDVKR